MFLSYELEDELLDMLDTYNCYTKPNVKNIRKILFELATQEIIQKPRYVANFFCSIFKTSKSHPFQNVLQLKEFYEDKKPT